MEYAVENALCYLGTCGSKACELDIGGGPAHQRHYYKHYGGIYYPLVRPVGVYLRYGELPVQHLFYFFYVEFFLFIHIAPPVSSASCAGIR